MAFIEGLRPVLARKFDRFVVRGSLEDGGPLAHNSKREQLTSVSTQIEVDFWLAPRADDRSHGGYAVRYSIRPRRSTKGISIPPGPHRR